MLGPYNSEVEERNVKLQSELFQIKEEMRLTIEEKAKSASKNAYL